MPFKPNHDRGPAKINRMKLDIRKAKRFIKPPRRAWEVYAFRAKDFVARSHRCHPRRRQERGGGCSSVSRTRYNNVKASYKGLKAGYEALALENRQCAGKIATLEDQLSRVREVIEDVFGFSGKRSATANQKEESSQSTVKKEGFDQEALDQWVLDQEELDTTGLEYLLE